eukprot:5985796-Amphidinium_carterae.1
MAILWKALVRVSTPHHHAASDHIVEKLYNEKTILWVPTVSRTITYYWKNKNTIHQVSQSEH